MFKDIKKAKGWGVLLTTRSILRLRVEKGELSWANLIFEFKTQLNQSYDTWCHKLNQVGMKKTIAYVRLGC